MFWALTLHLKFCSDNGLTCQTSANSLPKAFSASPGETSYLTNHPVSSTERRVNLGPHTCDNIWADLRFKQFLQTIIMVSGSDAIVNLSPVIESEKVIHSHWQHLFQTQNFWILYGSRWMSEICNFYSQVNRIYFYSPAQKALNHHHLAVTFWRLWHRWRLQTFWAGLYG